MWKILLECVSSEYYPSTHLILGWYSSTREYFVPKRVSATQKLTNFTSEFFLFLQSLTKNCQYFFESILATHVAVSGERDFKQKQLFSDKPQLIKVHMSDHRSMWSQYLCDFQFIDVHQYLNYLQNVCAHRNEAKTTINVVWWYCSETVIHIIPSGSDQIYRASLRKLNYYVYSAKNQGYRMFWYRCYSRRQ